MAHEHNPPKDEIWRPGMTIGRYQILDLLGRGGAGIVYKAKDTRLGRFVALKFLIAPSLQDRHARKRFEREARSVSALNHPNICTVHDAGEYEDQPFLVLEYLEGRTLRSKIQEGPATAIEVIDLALQLTDALDFAHRKGIIHRDIKPENIFLTAHSQAKLLDFGFAKLNPNAAANVEANWVDATDSTGSGFVMGTAGYMSPEQARVEDLDERTDLFSLGAVLYETITGKSAFPGSTLATVFDAILNVEPTPVRVLAPGAPERLAQLIHRALKKNRAARWASASELRAELKTVKQALEIPQALGDASIAVLPFKNLGEDREQDYFSEGLSEEIITALARIPGLRVIARTSAFAFRGTEQNARAIGERLKVSNILEGSVRRAGSHIRVTAQLVHVADESHAWSERYDRQATDIFGLQDEISEAIAAELKLKLVPQRSRVTSIAAYHDYLKGLYHQQRYSQDGLEKAKKFFDQAIAEDPDYAQAYAGLAAHYYSLALLAIKRMTDVAPLARSAAEKALKIEPSVNEAHSILGGVAACLDHDWKSAERHFQNGLSMETVSPMVRVRYALFFLAWWGRYDEAREQFEQALETDPLSMIVHFGLVMSHYWKRDYQRAIEIARRGLEINSNFFFVQFTMGMAELQAGSLRDAIACFEKTLEIAPWYSLTAGFLAAAYARAGNRDDAERLIGKYRELSERTYVPASCFAVYYASLGDADKAFEFLEAGLTERDPHLLNIKGEPLLDGLRSDPRYERLLGRMNIR